MADTAILLPGFPGKADRGFFGWCNVVLLTAPDVTMIVDTGSHGDRSLLVEALAARGIAPQSVERLFITHLHYDHCLNADLFPNAEILVSRRDWEYAWSDEPTKRGDLFVPRQYLSYLASRRIRLIEEGDTVASGVRALVLPGHTPGCAGLFIEESGLLIAGDALKSAREFAHRDPGLCFDSLQTALASIERIAALAKFILPGHDSIFALENGQIKGRTPPQVTLTHHANWQLKNGHTVILSAVDQDER